METRKTNKKIKLILPYTGKLYPDQLISLPLKMNLMIVMYWLIMWRILIITYIAHSSFQRVGRIIKTAFPRDDTRIKSNFGIFLLVQFKMMNSEE